MNREEAEKKCTYWACVEEGGDPTQWITDSPDEALEIVLETIPIPELLKLPKTIPLQGYVFSTVHYDASVLDMEYGSDDDDPTEPTDKMIAAEKVFLDAVCAEYKTQAVESVYKEEVDVMEWIKTHKPEWLSNQHVVTTG